jgi:hypothetical protein
MVRWLLKKILLHKELGMWQHGEEFTRFQLFRCKWFKIYLHRLKAPTCSYLLAHDHPWDVLDVPYLGRLLGADGLWQDVLAYAVARVISSGRNSA